MAIQHKMTQSFTRGNTTFTRVATKEASGEVNLDETIGAGATVALTLNLDVSAMKSLFILSDQVLTLKTNSSSAPDDTIPLAANSPIWWDKDNETATPNPLTADVTSLHAVNGTGNAASLQLFALQDVTP